MSQQGLRQASIRAVTGSAETYEGDWHRLFDLADIPAGPFNGRMLAWINIKLSAAYTNLAEAQQSLADANAAFNFASMGTFDASTFDYIVTDDSELAAVIALGSATLSGKRVGVMAGTYTTPDFNGLTPASTCEIVGVGTPRFERAIIRASGNLSFDGIKFTTAQWDTANGPCIRLGLEIGDVTLRNCQLRGNWEGDIDFAFDPTDLSATTANGFFVDNRYTQFAALWPTVDGSGTITALVASRRNVDLADGNYAVIFDGSAGGASGTGASADFDVVSGVITSINNLVGGSGYVQSGVGRICSWTGQEKAGEYFKYGIQAYNPGGDGGPPNITGQLTIEDCTFSLLGEGVKIGAWMASTGRMQIRRNTFDLIYQDSVSFAIGLAPPENIDVSFNFRTRPIFSPGDPGDPHADVVQVFADDDVTIPSPEITEGLIPIDIYGNVGIIGAARGQFQGVMLTDIPAGDPDTAFTAGALGLGVTANFFLMRGHGNGVSCSGSRWLPFAANTIVAWDTAESGNTIVISSDASVYPGTIVANNISEGYAGASDPDSDFLTWPNVTVDRDGSPLSYATVFDDPDSLPATVAAAQTAYTPLVAYEGKGAVGLVDFAAQTIDLSQMPTMTWFPVETGATVDTVYTSAASRILGGTASVTITPGTGTEWRVADNEAMDSNPTSWSSSVATGDYRGKFLQLRRTSSASGSTTVYATADLNGTEASFSITTASLASFSEVNNDSAAYSVRTAPTLESSLTRFILVFRYRGPTTPTSNIRILGGGTPAQFQIYNPSATTLRGQLGSSTIWQYRADTTPDDEWHTHFIKGDVHLGDTDLSAQQWWLDGTLLGKVDPSAFASGSTFTTANIFSGAGLGIFAEGDGASVVNGGDMAFVWMHWGDNTLTMPDFSDAGVRDGFTADNINLTNGSGALGYQPKIFLTGDAAAWNAGLSNGGSLGGTFTKGAGTYIAST
jgi:hypothetical protein